MSILLIVVSIIAFVVVLILIAAAMASTEYVVEQEIVIDRPKQTVFDYIKYTKNQNQYNKWWMMDPNARKEYVGTDGQPGFIMKWESDNKQAGKGEQETTRVTEGRRVDYVIRFLKPFVATSPSHIETVAIAPNQTKVIWIFSGERNFGMRIFHLLFNMKKMLGKDILTSLNNLKNILEKQ